MTRAPRICTDCPASTEDRGRGVKRCLPCAKKRKNALRAERRKSAEYRAREYAAKNAGRRERRATDPDYREKENAREKARNRLADPAYRARKNARQRERVRFKYQTDAEFRERERQRKAAPAFRKRDNERLREKYRSDPEWRERKLLTWRLRCQWDKTVTTEAINALMEQQDNACPYCSADLSNGFEFDHIVPASRGGKGTLANLQLTCMSCNRHKSDKDPEQFARERGLSVAA